MPREYCFVCASNEGIFLDIFTDGKNYRENIEICLSIKIQKRKIPTTKICHKCVYELDNCSKFIQRYNKTCELRKGKLYQKRGFCSLCMESDKKSFIFDLRIENDLDNSIEKLHELFGVDFSTEDVGNLSTCLDCRYNLDVLFDLKCLFKDISRRLEDFTSGDMTSEIPKMNTFVVKRQTTLTRMSGLSLSKSSLVDSDASTVIIESRTRSQTKNSGESSSNERKCDECNAEIESKTNMYRFHSTGNIVCKECWLTMDPNKKAKNKTKKSTMKMMKTKLCSVYLRDILSDSIESTKNDYKIEKNSDDEVIYISSDSENDNENKTRTLTSNKKRKNHVVGPKITKKMKTQNSKNKPLTRSNSVQCINVINKKQIRHTRSESAETSDSEGRNLRNRSKTLKNSLESKLKVTQEIKSRQPPTRAVTTKKRKTHNVNSSTSSIEIITPSKARRSSSPSFKIGSSRSESEFDTDINQSYKCKICSNDFENKIDRMTHELTHSKKLGVVLEKMDLSDTKEDNEMSKKESSIEFSLPGQSENSEKDSDIHLVATDELILRKLSPNDSDHNEQNQNKEALIDSKCKDSIERKKVEEEQDQEQGEGEEIKLKENEKKMENENEKGERKKEEEEEEKEQEKEKEKEKEQEKEKEEQEEEKEKEKEQEESESEQSDSEKNSGEATTNSPIDNRDEDSADDINNDTSSTIEMTGNEEATALNEIQVQTETEDDNSVEIEEEERDTESLETSFEKVNENEKDVVSQSKISINDGESLVAENNINDEKVDEIEQVFEEEKITEEGEKNHFQESISSEKLLDIEATEGNKNEEVDTTTEEKKFIEISNKSEECSNIYLNDIEPQNQIIANNNIDNAIQLTDDMPHAKNTEIDEKNCEKSTDIETQLAEMMRENVMNTSEVINENTANGTKNAEEILPMQPSTIENIA